MSAECITLAAGVSGRSVGIVEVDLDVEERRAADVRDGGDWLVLLLLLLLAHCRRWEQPRALVQQLHGVVLA